MRFDKLTQAIAAGGVWRLGMMANDLQIVSSSAPISVTLYKGGAVIGSGSNVLAGDFFRGVDFDLVELGTEVAQEITILLSDGTSGSNRVVGEVSVINGELSRVLANSAFSIAGSVIAAAGMYPFAQLWNPPASGMLLVLRKITLYGRSTQGVRITKTQTKLTDATLGFGISKKLGGAASAGYILLEQRPDLTIWGSDLTLMTVAENANQPLDIPFSEPIVVPEGWGLLVGGAGIGNGIAPSFQWTEEAN